MANSLYASLWNKYRPAIVHLMLASENGPQQYKLSHHEFKALNPKERAYAFELHAFQGKAVNSIKTSATAQEFLAMLNMSRKATELLEEIHFEFTLDKQFVLHITRILPSL
ncbi:MAG TPA: hypothetical protein VGK59_16015 [Ohtaekwangia sp.]